MYRTEITLRCCPAFTFTDPATKRFYPLICPEPRRQEAPTWREEVEFMLSSARLIIWYHLGLSAHLLGPKLSEISLRDSGDFYSLYRRWKPVSVSLTGSWRRWGSEVRVGFIHKLILMVWGKFSQKLADFSSWKTKKEKMWWQPSETVFGQCKKWCQSPVVFLKHVSLDGQFHLNLVPQNKQKTHHSYLPVKKQNSLPSMVQILVQTLFDGFIQLIINLPDCVCLRAENNLSEW